MKINFILKNIYWKYDSPLGWTNHSLKNLNILPVAVVVVGVPQVAPHFARSPRPMSLRQTCSCRGARDFLGSGVTSKKRTVTCLRRKKNNNNNPSQTILVPGSRLGRRGDDKPIGVVPSESLSAREVAPTLHISPRHESGGWGKNMQNHWKYARLVGVLLMVASTNRFDQGSPWVEHPIYGLPSNDPEVGNFGVQLDGPLLFTIHLENCGQESSFCNSLSAKEE